MLTQADVETGRGHALPNPEPATTDDIVAAVFRDHAATLRGVALRSTRDPELAEDVTQEAFLRLFIEARAGRMPDNVRAWLYRTSANLIVTRARKAAVARRKAPCLARFDGPAQPDAIALLNEERDELDAVMATLPPAHRIALVMAADGATGEEIADRLGRTHGATRTLLTRARGRLRVATMEAA
jgi:RNA polymerase sigma factor (sigma-70 family)